MVFGSSDRKERKKFLKDARKEIEKYERKKARREAMGEAIGGMIDNYQESQKQLAKQMGDATKDFVYDRILDINPKHIKGVYEYFLEETKGGDKETISSRKPHYVKWLIFGEGFIARQKIEVTLRLKELKNKLRLTVIFELKSAFRYYTKVEKKALLKQMDKEIEALYNLFPNRRKSKDFKFCYKCGTELKKDSKFCSECGTKRVED